MRRYDELIDEAEFLMIEYPEDVEIRIYLSIAYGAVGRYDDAIRIISESGLLDSLGNGWRNFREWDGYWAVMNAAYGSGEVDRAKSLAEWWITVHYHADGTVWSQALAAACLHAIIGDDDEVYRRFQRAQQGKYLVWRPMLEDAQCFKRFEDDPVYLETSRHYEQLRSDLRAKLPQTLARHGVSLDQSPQ